MSGYFKWAKAVSGFCGGWWPALSGGLSVPLACLALFWQASPRKLFAVLAYCGMCVFAIGIKRKAQAVENGLNREIQFLNERLDTSKERELALANLKIVKDKLGIYLQMIESRMIHIRTIEPDQFTDEIAFKETFDWNKDFEEISVYLKSNFPDAESALFESITTLQRTKIEVVENALLSDTRLVERRRLRAGLIDNLAQRSKQLQTIIEKLF
jgi:hypothetical protein